ncbi:MAG: peptide-methionine (S)-S-oxide reductase MsrA [Opitutaceae bacterium]
MIPKNFNRVFSSSIAVIAFFFTACSVQETVEDKNAPPTIKTPKNMKSAVLGAGCFWCVESFYEHLDGVYNAVSGYAGGTEEYPTYKQVSHGLTSHAEVVKVIYNPKVISYRELVDFFWTTHDVTRSDGVAPDFGPHYRSILLFENEEEKAAIEASRLEYESKTGKTIATEIKALNTFYVAESYHQDYAANNPSDRYVQGVLNPKLKKLGFK